ncbi:hypothetical protein [Thioclava sp. ES.031]|uniref:hypothetical protein n=1 Tax=Thioclava sp. ES.031 TaxID=1798203 RepID=UPI0020D21651|nr:hypothetical protein [Thioclava sp. ES.031]
MTAKIARSEAPAADPISAQIGAEGIAPVLADLQSRDALAPKDRFALGGLEFLASLEATMRWQMEAGAARLLMPFIGNVPGGRDAPRETFTADAVTRQSEALIAGMNRAKTALDGLADGAEFGLAINLNDLWFDLNGNGARDDGGEDAVTLLRGAFMPRSPEAAPGASRIVRFDNADAAWLSAYTHLISGVGELTLAFDPEPAIARVMDTYAKLVEARDRATGTGQVTSMDGMMMFSFIDPAAAVLDMLHQQPDPTRTRAARDHWLAMIAQNRQFWELAEAETDNQAEWIPSDAQDQALGVEFPDGLGETWRGVLSDGEALLTSEKSFPFWRVPVGVDLGAWLENPAPLPLTGVVQGWALDPYFTDTPMLTPENWTRFSRLVGRRTGMMMFTLN